MGANQSSRRRPKHLARHTEASVSTPAQLVWRMAKTGRIHYAGMLLSDYGREILSRKYDAFATDHAYTVEPHGRLGPIGKSIDLYVLKFPLHVGLRQRLGLVAKNLTGAVQKQSEMGRRPVRVLSAPCGLARDIITAASRLDTADIPVQWTGLDIDENGDVLPEAERRAGAGGVDIEFLREDLFAPKSALTEKVSKEGKFHIVNSIGLTAWVDLPDVKRLLSRFAELIEPAGTLIVDNFHLHKHSKLGPLLEMPTRYHPDADFRAAIQEAGFGEITQNRTANGVNSVYAATATLSK